MPSATDRILFFYKQRKLVDTNSWKTNLSGTKNQQDWHNLFMLLSNNSCDLRFQTGSTDTFIVYRVIEYLYGVQKRGADMFQC